MERAKLRDICDRLINLKQAMKNCEEKVTEELHPEGEPLGYSGTDLANHYIKRIEDCEKEIDDMNKFFDSLTDDEIFELLTIMYTGRDEMLPHEGKERDPEMYDEYGDYTGELEEEEEPITFEDAFNFYKKSNNRDGAEFSLRGKAQLIDYLKSGMNYFSIY